MFRRSEGVKRARCIVPLQELQRIHVNEDRGLGDFFFVAIGEDAGEDFCELGFAFGFQEKLKTVFRFEAC